MEYIGFIISILALIYLFFMQTSSIRQQQKSSREIENDHLFEEDPLKEFMTSTRSDDQEGARYSIPPSPKIIKQVSKPAEKARKDTSSILEEYRSANMLETRQLKSSLEHRTLKPAVGKLRDANSLLKKSLLHEGECRATKPSKAELAMRRLINKRDLIIYQEIIDKPMSMRSHRW